MNPVTKPLEALGFPVLLMLIILLAGCHRKSTVESTVESGGPRDFSTASQVTIALGEPAGEAGEGLQLISWSDGLSSPAVLDGVPCRQLNLPPGGTGYFYFALDPSFKKGDSKDFRVDVEFFDDQPGVLSLQFDGSKTWQTRDATYVGTDHNVGLTGAKRWKVEPFKIHDATFNNAQNGRADFRLRVNSPNLYVSRVTVTRVSKQRRDHSPIPWSGDFSTTNTVSIPLGDLSQEREQGLFHITTEKDGRTAVTNLNGTSCRFLARPDKRWDYFYFAIDDSFKNGNLRDADIEVECFDARRAVLNIEFDASKSRNISAPAYAKTTPDARFTGSQSWHTNVFHIHNATFENSQNGGADFRLLIGPPALYVRRVTVTRREAQPPDTR